MAMKKTTMKKTAIKKTAAKKETNPKVPYKASLNEVTGRPFKVTSIMTRDLMNRAYDLRTIKKINATPAEKAKQTRQSIDASRTAARAEAIANREDKKKAAKAAAKKASYSPKPMSAIEKRAAGFRGATTQYQINLKKKK